MRNSLFHLLIKAKISPVCRDANSNNRDLKNASSTSCVFSGTLLVATSLNSTTVRRNSEGRCSDHTTLAVTVHIASAELSKQAEKQQCLKTQICSFSDHLTFSSNICSFKLGLLQKKKEQGKILRPKKRKHWMCLLKESIQKAEIRYYNVFSRFSCIPLFSFLWLKVFQLNLSKSLHSFSFPEKSLSSKWIIHWGYFTLFLAPCLPWSM